MDDLTSTTGIVALAAAAAAVLALVGVGVLARQLSRWRSQQRVVLGAAGTDDLVAHAAKIEHGFESLNAYVTDVTTRLDGRLGVAERRLDGVVAHTALVRYDAYNEMSGRQSTSIALLDTRGTGIVISSIHHRDQARLYAKQVVEGRGQLELSPEELEAVRSALAGEVPDAAEPGQ